MSEQPSRVSADGASSENAVRGAEQGDTASVTAHIQEASDVVASGELDGLCATSDVVSDDDVRCDIRAGVVGTAANSAALRAVS